MCLSFFLNRYKEIATLDFVFRKQKSYFKDKRTIALPAGILLLGVVIVVKGSLKAQNDSFKTVVGFCISFILEFDPIGCLGVPPTEFP